MTAASDSDDAKRNKTSATAPSSPPPAQLVLDWPHRSASTAADFLIGPSNRAAATMILERWPMWPGPALLLVGSPGCGKSHLAGIWRDRASARWIAATDLDDQMVADVASERAIVIDGIDQITGAEMPERVAFHLLNLARETQISILLTSCAAPGDIDCRLPDLRSRLRAMPFVAIDVPNDALLSGTLVKLFDDRQLKVDPSVVTYIVRHMERTMAAAHRIVAEIDLRALATRRRVTRALAAEILGQAGGDAGDGELQ
jgi:chromosomal replication initiation ATPase DnaA